MLHAPRCPQLGNLVCLDGEKPCNPRSVVQAAHEDACSILRYNDENSLACSLSLALYAIRKSHTVVRELPAGKGFADLVFVPRPSSPLPAVIVELKRDASPHDALAQIHERDYVHGLAGLACDAVLVGISYDSKTKVHSCKIEQTEI